MPLAPLVAPGPPLDAEEAERWSRHLLLPDLGEVGQRRLRAARVCVVGAGGLGAPVLQYLAAAGVGTLGVVDDDVVDSSNLQRQVVHGEADVGRPKVASAADAVRRLSSRTRVVEHPVRLDASTAGLLDGYDLVVDGTDTFGSRYAVADACARRGLPEVWGSVLRTDAQVSVFWGRPPAGSGVVPVQLRDLFPVPPAPGEVPSCAEAGVLGALCGVVGSLMALQAVQLLTGTGEPLLGRVAVLDAARLRWREVPLVGRLSGAVPEDAPSPSGAREDDVPVVAAAALVAELAAVPAGTRAPVVVDVREHGERALVRLPASVHVPLAALLAQGDGRVPGVEDDAPLVVHCAAGVRSARAVAHLLAAGRRGTVRSLAGGVQAWVRAGGEVVRGTGPAPTTDAASPTGTAPTIAPTTDDAPRRRTA
ncbi:ThiF family adenylyltransferase [Cellulomonas marina]|uniref:ThiF family adenylyltransferase n=1 Tax=Cellulomonas marina TaxID=988821 RepID=UPI000B7EB909|nr:ThiF family adenylyltransferase [Cellulomonas marina]